MVEDVGCLDGGASCLDAQRCIVFSENSRHLHLVLTGMGRCRAETDDGVSLGKGFYSTRLETRTKESSTCANSRVLNLRV